MDLIKFHLSRTTDNNKKTYLPRQLKGRCLLHLLHRHYIQVIFFSVGVLKFQQRNFVVSLLNPHSFSWDEEEGNCAIFYLNSLTYFIKLLQLDSNLKTKFSNTHTFHPLRFFDAKISLKYDY